MNLWEPITVAPRSSVLLRARFVPTAELLSAYANKLTIATNDVNKPSVEVNFTATVVVPPKFVLNNATILVNADVKSHKETKQFVIDNTTG
ncbi:MAG TPA: hypothetical protein DCQ31_17695, partial [Bacteroidales bacterium]|nr:hypothetical protein [Bacteroidales bacterium]